MLLLGLVPVLLVGGVHGCFEDKLRNVDLDVKCGATDTETMLPSGHRGGRGSPGEGAPHCAFMELSC